MLEITLQVPTPFYRQQLPGVNIGRLDQVLPANLVIEILDDPTSLKVDGDYLYCLPCQVHFAGKGIRPGFIRQADLSAANIDQLEI